MTASDKQAGDRRAACPHFVIIKVPKNKNPPVNGNWSVLGQSRALPLFSTTVFSVCCPISRASRAARQTKATTPCESKESHKTAGCALAKIPSLSRHQLELEVLDLLHPAGTSVLCVTKQFKIPQARFCKICNFHLYTGSYSMSNGKGMEFMSTNREYVGTTDFMTILP